MYFFHLCCNIEVKIFVQKYILYLQCKEQLLVYPKLGTKGVLLLLNFYGLIMTSFLVP